MYTCLQRAGFKHNQIEQSMNSTVQYGGDLIDALDWLCLNLANGKPKAVIFFNHCGYIWIKKKKENLAFSKIVLFNRSKHHDRMKFFRLASDTMLHDTSKVTKDEKSVLGLKTVITLTDVINFFHSTWFIFTDQLPERFSEALENEEQRKRPKFKEVSMTASSNQPITADLRHVEEPRSVVMKTKQVWAISSCLPLLNKVQKVHNFRYLGVVWQ